MNAILKMVVVMKTKSAQTSINSQKLVLYAWSQLQLQPLQQQNNQQPFMKVEALGHLWIFVGKGDEVARGEF